MINGVRIPPIDLISEEKGKDEYSSISLDRFDTGL
jgi:hypothetical protein